jgi:hypothetical protein
MVMKKGKYVIALALSAVCMVATGPLGEAGQAKGGKSNAGGKAGTHMSGKGTENTNAQWSADPERGWVRADERHDKHEKKPKSKDEKQSNGKHKGK